MDPAHKDVDGNERAADKLAKLEASNNNNSTFI